MASEQYPLYPQAVILPALAFPAWILCIPPFVWHFSQHNLATWSLISWFIILNLFNSINPLIWPRDNVDEWWSGSGLCDIEIRLLNSASIGLAACTTMMMRKLAKVMDTRNITVSTSRSSRRREKFLEAFVCWGYPAFMMLVYYFVQPLRYYIYGISGCVSPISLSWVTIVLDTMWPAITICFAGYYAGKSCIPTSLF
jgi:pheromone a factor receptor